MLATIKIFRYWGTSWLITSDTIGTNMVNNIHRIWRNGKRINYNYFNAAGTNVTIKPRTMGVHILSEESSYAIMLFNLFYSCTIWFMLSPFYKEVHLSLCSLTLKRTPAVVIGCYVGFACGALNDSTLLCFRINVYRINRPHYTRGTRKGDVYYISSVPSIYMSITVTSHEHHMVSNE